MLIKILSKRWPLRFCRLVNDHGQCDPPDQVGREIRINKALKGKDLLETLIHEFEHGTDSDWKVSEEYITEKSDDLATLLWRLGYRRLSEMEQ